jgi:hypothetical protein
VSWRGVLSQINLQVNQFKESIELLKKGGIKKDTLEEQAVRIKEMV